MSQGSGDEARQDGAIRRLIWLPIIHTREDMGRLGRRVEESYVRRLGRVRWEAHQDAVSALWGGIRSRIDELDLDFGRVRLFQDGLPVCGHEERIVRELASQGSLNHRLLVDLMGRGAALMGSESPQLLLEEYELNRRILGHGPRGRASATRAEEIRAEAGRLLEARDRFIAGRIAEALRPGETGLVFLGLLHSLRGRLPLDVNLTLLTPREGRDPVPR